MSFMPSLPFSTIRDGGVGKPVEESNPQAAKASSINLPTCEHLYAKRTPSSVNVTCLPTLQDISILRAGAGTAIELTSNAP